jgi:glucoamylase
MATFRGTRIAFGAPGIEPRWTAGDKYGVGTAYSASSRLWFTIARGIVTEIYYPTVDRPQIRDFQLLFTDGESFFHEERRHLKCQMERIDCSLGYRIRSVDPEGRYTLIKEIVSNPHLPCLLVNCKIEGDETVLKKLNVYVLCAPHIDGAGRHNNAHVIEVAGRQILAAERSNRWLTVGSTSNFSKLSCGYVGFSDGWQDLSGNYKMDWEFDCALDGNVALTGQIDVAHNREFTLALSFGEGLHSSITTLLQVLNEPFSEHSDRFIEQWRRPQRGLMPIEASSGDGGHLYRTSFNLLLAHEDKNYQGAMIASLSIPWGESKGDEDGIGGYHLVWTRDMVHSATGLFAAGNTKTPRKAIFYLAASQQPDGSFAQNFWINGEAYWHGIQLDELAFPIILIYRLVKSDLLGPFSVNTGVRAIAFLALQGPATRQERWEEVGGYSPSTLAAIITSLICAATMARDRHRPGPAQFLEEYADYLVANLEDWTVTHSGSLLPGVKRHFVRAYPIGAGEAARRGSLDSATIRIANLPPGARSEFPANQIVDPGFLELVRYGILRPNDPLVEDSLRVIDAVCKVDTPYGPVWRRYNNDGYGQGEKGEPFQEYGVGRAWPLLTGERGHYELAAGRDPMPYLRTMERLATPTGMLTEQIWDAPDLPSAHMVFGKPTGAAMPLMWAHAEYIKLLRSAHDGKVFDLVPEVAARYQDPNRELTTVDFWCFNHPTPEMDAGHTLRILAAHPFHLRWTTSEWQEYSDTHSGAVIRGLDYVDIQVPRSQSVPVRFTFFWTSRQVWEGRDFSVAVHSRES